MRELKIFYCIGVCCYDSLKIAEKACNILIKQGYKKAKIKEHEQKYYIYE